VSEPAEDICGQCHVFCNQHKFHSQNIANANANNESEYDDGDNDDDDDDDDDDDNDNDDGNNIGTPEGLINIFHVPHTYS
jgi:hypothetical protein